MTKQDRFNTFEPSPFAAEESAANMPARFPLWKRAFDLALVVPGIILLLPVLLIVAFLVRRDGGPALFVQTRIGLNGIPFRIYKFRSMVVNAEALRAQLLAQSEREGVCFKMENDPRITRIGRLLRRTSIDELPQLVNVLKGEMSLVGPRPALPEEVAAYSSRARLRLKAPPGITGVWQVSGRANVSFEQMVEMDIGYIAATSVKSDVIILCQTLSAVTKGSGAY